MDTKTRPVYTLSTRDHFRPRDTYTWKVRGGKKIFHANGNKKKAVVAILISDKIDLEIRLLQETKRTLHYDQGINPRYNNCKYLCTQHT